MPQISIIVPVYKVENYLHKCLDSILAQTFTDWECILIDDGSPDNSGAICDEYAQQDSRFRVIHQENKGSAGTRNVGLQMAQGIYLICVDSDDWVEPDYLECLYNEAERTGADVVGCNLVREYEGKSVEVKNQLPLHPQECIRGLLEGWIQGWLHVKLLRRSLLVEKNINFVEGINLWEDMIFSVKLFTYATKVSSVNLSLYHYRFNSQSLVNTFNERRVLDLIRVVKEIECFFREQGVQSDYYRDFLLLKSRVKYDILCESKNEIKKKYIKIYPEIDVSYIRNQSMPVIKKIIFRTFLKEHFCLGAFLMIPIKLRRYIIYNF